MTKTCPNCGVNSPDNSKFCIECGYDIKDIPINKEKEEEKPPQKPKPADSSSDGGNTALGCIILIVIIVLIAAVGFFIFGSGDDSSTDAQTDFTITFDEVYAYDFESNGKTYYNYVVNGFFNHFPDDAKDYIIKTIYYDANGNELTSTTEKLSSFDWYRDNDYSAIISSYQTQNYIDVDHVSVQIIKDNVVVNEFNATMNTNKLTTIPNSSSNSNSSK